MQAYRVVLTVHVFLSVRACVHAHAHASANDVDVRGRSWREMKQGRHIHTKSRRKRDPETRSHSYLVLHSLDWCLGIHIATWRAQTSLVQPNQRAERAFKIFGIFCVTRVTTEFPEGVTGGSAPKFRKAVRNSFLLRSCSFSLLWL